ncbi:hypothetical protein HZA57_08325, partial [Candidatus Poribacteria bacterium]|nr:hypothetical protein [Candidatus Poribacteria bacterium]
MPHHQPILHIESRQNPRVREWVKLQSPKGRRLAGLFIAESEHLVDEAVLSGIEITDLLVREGTRPLR